MTSPESQPASPTDETFPQAWLPYLHANVFLYSLLPEADQLRLRRLIPHFIASKFWEGCAGLTLTDEIRVTIAAHACLLLLGLENFCFENCQTILVYPGGYLHVEEDSLGIAANAGHNLGEAHHGGPVVLSWWHACWDGRHHGASNVVLHEFAHKLAEEGNRRYGLPPLRNPSQERRWKKVFAMEYDRLVEDAARERPTLLDPYGASNRAEFFAVATEAFFLRSRELERRHGALYELLAEFYRQNPAAWRRDEAAGARTQEAEEQYLRHALAECDRALQLDPQYLDAYRQRAELYEDLGELDKALADYSRLLELAPRNARAELHYERGRLHHLAEHHEQAISDFSEAIYRFPDFAEAYRERAAVHVSRGENEQALADLNHALKLDPEDDQAYLDRGCLWRTLKRLDKALRDLTRSIRLCPYRVEAYCERAAVHLDQRQNDRALADCDEALRLEPDCREAQEIKAALQGER